MPIKETKPLKTVLYQKKRKKEDSQDKELPKASFSGPKTRGKDLRAYLREDNFQKRLDLYDNMTDKEKKIIIEGEMKNFGFEYKPLPPLPSHLPPTVYGWEKHVMDDAEEDK